MTLPKISHLNGGGVDSIYTDLTDINQRKVIKKVKKLKSQIRDRLLEQNKISRYVNSGNDLMKLEICDNTADGEKQESVTSADIQSGPQKISNRFGSVMNKKAFLLTAAKNSLKASVEQETLKSVIEQEPPKIKTKIKMGTFVNLAMNVGKVGTNLRKWSDGFGKL